MGVFIFSHIFFNSPDVTLYYLEFWGLDQNKEPEHPEQILLGRKVGAQFGKSVLNQLSSRLEMEEGRASGNSP